MGLLSARGTKAGDHFNYASHVAERVASEQEKRAAGERRELLQKKKLLFRERLRKRPTGGAVEDEDEEEAEEPEDTPEAVAAVESEMMAVLGRSSSCEVKLARDDQISRRHAQIEARDGGLWVRDLGSTYGTMLNGTKLDGSGPLKPGDSLAIGASSFRLQMV